MTNFSHPAEVISLHQIARKVNTDNLNDEILVFDHEISFDQNEVFPLRIDALIIALCTSGNGKIGIDLREYEIKENTIVVIQPQNYVYLCNYSDDFRCSAVACSRHVVEDVIPKLTDVLPLLMHHRTEPITYLSAPEAKDIMSIYSLLRNKLHQTNTPFVKQKALCLLQAALYELMEINLRKSTDIEPQRSRKEEIMARFLLTVTENFKTERQVAYYAHKLFITPKHLSSVVKEISGRTAGDWIENYVIMEAKVLLKTTDMTIQEVADYLHFANQSFFGKYFKHHTGVSPTAYRKQFT